MKLNFSSIILLIIVASAHLHPQTFVFEHEMGNFKSASSFYITSAGILYVADEGTNEIFKLDTLGNIQKFTGGYGWDEGQFDNPSDIFANPLSVYVCDKNNSRIERFDKDLNYVSSLYTRDNDNKDERFGYPLSCSISPQGDLYILDSENKRIVKFDLFGNFSQNFGGYDAGQFSLLEPKQLAISSDNKIYVLDNNRIVVFDQYGNNVRIIKDTNNFLSIRIIFDKMTLCNQSNIFFADLREQDFNLKKLNLNGLPKSTVILNSLIFNNKLYILTAKNILVFKAG